jgi:hypothetical protein
MINTDNFIRKFNKRFGKYNYEIGFPTTAEMNASNDVSEVKSMHIPDGFHDDTKIVIVCKEHGPFEMSANKILNGFGCPTCGVRKLVNDYFIALYGEKNPTCSFACEKFWGFNARHTSDIPKEIVYAIKFALDDPYVKTWGDFRSVFNAVLDAQEFCKKDKDDEEKQEKVKQPIIKGCTSRAHAIEVAERIKRIREEKKKKKNDGV